MSSESETNIEQLLTNALSPDKSVNQSAINILNKMSQENLSIFLQNLGNILSNEGKPSGIRQLSAILMKNYLIYYENLQYKWKNELSKEDKDKIKLLVLSTLASQYKEIRTSASNVIASICKIDQPIINHWPDLIDSLTKNVFNEDKNLKLAAIETLGFVCEEISIKGIDNNSVDSIIFSLIKTLQNDSNDINIVIQVLKALFYCVKLAEKYFSFESKMQIIMMAIFSIGEQYQNNEDVLDKIAMLFIEMLSISNYYDYINPYFEQIIKFSFNIINSKYESNVRLALLGMEIICSIGDEELKREPNKIIITQTTNGLKIENPKNSRKYFNRIHNDLKNMILKFVEVPNDDEDESEWNLSKGCLHILSILVCVVDLNNISDFFQQLSLQIQKSENINNRCKCWYLLGGSIQTVYKSEMNELISKNLNKILKDIEINQNIQLKKSASYLLTKITKYFPKIIDVSKLGSVFTILLNALKYPNTIISLNICKILQNIIKNYGDYDTNKSSNPISIYFDEIILGLFIPVVNEAVSKTEDTKVALSRLVTIGILIDYSSHDKQDKILEILIQFLKEIESTYIQFQNMISNGSNIEKIYQLQEYYYATLRIIFNKYKSPINLELGRNIWELTNNIFTFRKTVFEEANLALGSLATNMKESFTEIFNKYYPFINYSIKSYNISSLCKSGLVSLLNSIRGIGKNIKPNAKDIISTLIDVCTSNDVSRGNKTIAISCLGEIAFNIGLQFSEFLPTVMKLLFSACEMGININSDEDEDTIEFIINLRYEIIMTFTCIEFSVEDKTELLNPYIQNIFKFFHIIVNDQVCMAPKILTSMISFVADIVNIYGNNIKEVCDEQFASNLINNLKKYNIPNYESQLAQHEELFKILYHSN